MSTAAGVPIVVPCNICGSTEFVSGPSGRLSMSQRLPLCAKCGGLARHRAVRTVFDALPDDLFRGTMCLQFSPDPALDPARFEQPLADAHCEDGLAVAILVLDEFERPAVPAERRDGVLAVRQDQGVIEHGRRGFDRLMLGSDAQAVLNDSTVPVLLVRQPDAG